MTIFVTVVSHLAQARSVRGLVEGVERGGDSVNLRLAKRPLGGAYGLDDLALASSAHDRGGDFGSPERPRHGQLRDCVPAWLGDGLELSLIHI